MAKNVQLINCNGVVVTGDVENFVGIGLSNMEINSDFNGSILFGKVPSIEITTSTTLTAAYNNKTVYVDATTGDVTLTWNITNMEDMNVYIIRKDNSANKIFIDSTVAYGTENFIGNGLPYDLNLVRYNALPLTSKSDTIYVRS